MRFSASGGDEADGFRRRTVPENEIGAPLDLTVNLVMNADLAIVLTAFTVYRNGLRFTAELRVRDGRSVGDREVRLAEAFGGRLSGGDAVLFGVEMADDRSCAAIGHGHRSRRAGDDQGAVMMPQGSGAGDTSASASWFLSPLPPPGPLTFHCAWAEAGVDVAVAIDAAVVLDAVPRAHELWPWQPMPEPRAWNEEPRTPLPGWFAQFDSAAE